MPNNQEQQILHFLLTLVAVKMKVKFPCRMILEQAGHAITKEVPPAEECRFIFNQEIRLREESDKSFSEISVCLVTEKGARYVSASLKLYHNELVRAEGERLVVSLSKCLDSEALCELRVDKVIKEGGQRKRTLTTIQERTQKTNNPRMSDQLQVATPLDFKSSKKIEPALGGSETKSEAHFPVTANLRFRKEEEELRSKEYIGLPATSVKRFGNPSPKSKRAAVHSKNKYQGLDFVEERDRAIEGEVYRQNYLKLKQKYQREAENSKNELSRRMMLQNNENNYKLEIVRLKIRNDELQKNLQEKGLRLKEVSAALSALQGRQADINIMRQDIANKQHALHILEDTVLTLSRENDELRASNKDIAFKLEEKILLLENQVDSANGRSLSRQQELQRELKMMGETLQFKETELARKNDLLEKEKRNVYDLERSIQNKLFEYDSLLQAEKANCRAKIEEAKSKIDESSQILTKVSAEKNQAISQLDRLKGLLLKNEYEFKLYQQEINNLRGEIEELRPLRDKYNEIFKELRVISEQKTILQKNHEKIVLAKDSTLDQITMEYKKEIDFQKRSAKEHDERAKTLSSKLIQTEAQLDLTKSAQQKLRKSLENTTRDLLDVKEKEKGIKKSLKMKEQECQDLKKQLIRAKQKGQAILDSLRLEMGRAREELTKTKQQLQAQIAKNEHIMEANAEMSMEIARIRTTQQISEQKYEKLVHSAQQKYSQFQRIIKQHESVIQLLEEKIKAQKGNEKEYFNKLQKCDYEINVVVDKNDKIAKEARAFEERTKHLEATLKIKQAQLSEALRNTIEQESKLNQAEEKMVDLKESLQLSKNQLEKSKKIIEILQKDYDRAKTDILLLTQKLTQKQRECQEKGQQIRKDRQTISNLQNKQASLRKQYDKFRDSVTEAMNTSFAQLLHSFSLDKQENSKVSTFDHSNINSSKLIRGIADLSNDLASVISQAGKENKGQINKLSDRIKQLERDLEIMKNQGERAQETSKRQLQDKTLYISQLQEQVRNLKSEKAQIEAQLHFQIQELQENIKEYQGECQNLHSIKGEHEFSINSLRMQIEQINEDYQKKLLQLKKERQQYEQKLQYQYHTTETVEKKGHELEVEIMNLNAVVMLEKQASYKKELKLQQIEDEKDKYFKECQNVRKQLKLTQEKYSELEIQYITVNQIKEKYESMLSQEEIKLKDVRIFNNNILKEKQQIIKKELEKNLQIANLQNTINDLHHTLQQQEAAKNKYKTDYQQTKQQTKRLILQIKELQSTVSQQRNKYADIRDKLRQKETHLNEAKEEALSIKKKLEENNQKNKVIIEELQEEMDMTTRQLQTVTAQTNETIRGLQAQISKLTQQIQVNKEEMAELQESIFVQRQNNQSMQETITKLRVELQQSKHRLQEIEHSYEQLLEENREKDENMFELGGKIYQLQGRLKEAEQEKLREIEELNNSLNVKYDEDYQQIYQKIEFIEKQKEYFKEKCHQKQEALSKKNEELKHKEIEQGQLKKAYEDKIKKIQQQKLLIFTDKNKQINKILQDNKSQFEAIRLKESQIRKVAHQLEISRTTIHKLEAKIKEMQNDKSNQAKLYQTEIESLRKKELGFKSYKDLIRTNQWNCQREVRKNIQSFIKRVLQVGQKEVRNENFISMIKGLEEGLLTVIATITKQ